MINFIQVTFRGRMENIESGIRNRNRNRNRNIFLIIFFSEKVRNTEHCFQYAMLSYFFCL